MFHLSAAFVRETIRHFPFAIFSNSTETSTTLATVTFLSIGRKLDLPLQLLFTKQFGSSLGPFQIRCRQKGKGKALPVQA